MNMGLDGEKGTNMATPTPRSTEDVMKGMYGELIDLKMSRNSRYRNSPLNILPLEYWLAQIAIKAVRAEQCNTAEMVVEELDDLIVYATFAKMKIAGYTIT